MLVTGMRTSRAGNLERLTQFDLTPRGCFHGSSAPAWSCPTATIFARIRSLAIAIAVPVRAIASTATLASTVRPAPQPISVAQMLLRRTETLAVYAKFNARTTAAAAGRATTCPARVNASNTASVMTVLGPSAPSSIVFARSAPRASVCVAKTDFS